MDLYTIQAYSYPYQLLKLLKDVYCDNIMLCINIVILYNINDHQFCIVEF